MRLSSLLPCWQHLELEMEPEHVSCKPHEVKSLILTFSHSGKVCMVVCCLESLECLTLWRLGSVSHRYHTESLVRGFSTHNLPLTTHGYFIIKNKAFKSGSCMTDELLTGFWYLNINSRASSFSPTIWHLYVLHSIRFFVFL